MEFKDLKLNEKILKAAQDEGYKEPSPIQQQAIPAAIEGRDILGCAQTGTGKTAAFAMPILHRLLETEGSANNNVNKEKDERQYGANKSNTNAGGNTKNKGERRKIRALILTPTRELALQIHESFDSYGRYTKLKYGVIMGGVSQYGQIQKLNAGLDILVATPGRLLDLIYHGYVEISGIEVFVLDEADRMLDMGFIDDVRKIIDILPKNRQTLFFTATMPPEIKKLTDTILTNPVSISVTPVSSTVDLTEQRVFYTDKINKQELLIWYLKTLPKNTQALVFTRTKYGAEKLSRNVNKAALQSKALHGDKSQSERQYALTKFKDGSLPVLIATDIAARGIDIESLPLVINFELPDSPETYVHRIGRTGRAGREGLAISFCDSTEKRGLKAIERLIKKELIVIDEHPYPLTNHDPEPPKKLQKYRRYNKNAPAGQPKKPQ